jgi:hypothetical protein
MVGARLRRRPLLAQGREIQRSIGSDLLPGALPCRPACLSLSTLVAAGANAAILLVDPWSAFAVAMRLLTVQTSVGFLLTLLTIHLVPVMVATVGWTYGFACLAVGPVIGVYPMWRLRISPDALKLAGGRR